MKLAGDLKESGLEDEIEDLDEDYRDAAEDSGGGEASGLWSKSLGIEKMAKYSKNGVFGMENIGMLPLDGGGQGGALAGRGGGAGTGSEAPGRMTWLSVARPVS